MNRYTAADLYKLGELVKRVHGARSVVIEADGYDAEPNWRAHTRYGELATATGVRTVGASASPVPAARSTAELLADAQRHMAKLDAEIEANAVAADVAGTLAASRALWFGR